MTTRYMQRISETKKKSSSLETFVTKDGVVLNVGLHNQLFRTGKLKPSSLESARLALAKHLNKRVTSI